MKLYRFIVAVLLLAFVVLQTNAQIAYPRFQKHMVLEGETAASIAEHFHISKKDFCLQNDFPENVKLQANQVVLIRKLESGEKEIEEQGTTAKPRVKAEITESTPAKKETTKTVVKENPAKAEKTVVTKEPAKPAPVKEVAKAEEKFVVPPPSTKAIEVGPHGIKYNVSKTGYHTVERGQTFFRIALIYGLSVGELQKLNNLPNTSIELGQKLKVRK